MAKKIYCEKCQKVITYNGDLVTAIALLKIYPFHTACYSKFLKGAPSLILSNEPLNGSMSNFKNAMYLLFSLGWFIFAPGKLKWIALLTIPLLTYRLFSFLLFERHLL